MNTLLRLLSYLYSYELNRKIRVALDMIYAAWIRREFKSVIGHFRVFSPLTLYGAKYMCLGENVTLKGPLRLEAFDEYNGQHFSPNIYIGDFAKINSYCHIGCINEVRIGKYTTIAERCYITDHMHGETTLEHLKMHTYSRPLFSKGKVNIGDCVQIGEGCVIMPGVSIGEHSIIGANSVVTKDIPPYCIAAGNPAKVLKTF